MPPRSFNVAATDNATIFLISIFTRCVKSGVKWSASEAVKKQGVAVKWLNLKVEAALNRK
jgi:hypothetical protein